MRYVSASRQDVEGVDAAPRALGGTADLIRAVTKTTSSSQARSRRVRCADAELSKPVARRAHCQMQAASHHARWGALSQHGGEWTRCVKVYVLHRVLQ